MHKLSNWISNPNRKPPVCCNIYASRGEVSTVCIENITE